MVENGALVFPSPTLGEKQFPPTKVNLFKASEDPSGVASHVPHMDHFYDNSLQTGLMRELALDLEVLNQHIVLLGNQGVGKNKVVDRLCQLLGRPREYIQLHRDTTVNQLMFTTTLDNGVINYTDSPLLRAIKYGRFIIIDEADKAPEHVVAILRILAGQGELSLSGGRRVRPTQEREGDIVVHPNFRLILLANRPGYRESTYGVSWVVISDNSSNLKHSLETTSFKFLARTLAPILLRTQIRTPSENSSVNLLPISARNL